MKKVTKTTTSTPATPAPVPAKKASVKTPAAAKQATAAKPTAAPEISKPAAAPVSAKPAVKAPPASPATKISALVDVGFGNTLYIRGEGPGLSWEKGVPLDNLTDTQWSITLAASNRPIVYKFLINDLTWSSGEDYVSQPGSSAELIPIF